MADNDCYDSSSCNFITVKPADEKSRVAWEDKTTGKYYRENRGIKITENEYRRYTNVNMGNKSEGYSAKYYVEEKYEKPPQTKGISKYHNHKN